MDLYPTYMITLISIIQAAALGYLLLAANDQLSYIIAGTYDPIWTILIVGMFVMIVATWAQYGSMVLVLRLVPSTMDALVPFCLGVTQALAIFSIIHQQIAWFYFAMSLNSIVLLSAYISVFREARLQQDRVENRTLVELAGTYPRTTKLVAVARSVIFFSFGVAETLLKLNSLYLAIFVLVMNVVLFVGSQRTTSTRTIDRQIQVRRSGRG